jgi:hypothetical protein
LSVRRLPWPQGRHPTAEGIASLKEQFTVEVDLGKGVQMGKVKLDMPPGAMRLGHLED